MRLGDAERHGDRGVREKALQRVVVASAIGVTLGPLLKYLNIINILYKIGQQPAAGFAQ